MANWLKLPSGWLLNFDLVVIAEGLRWSAGGLREPTPTLTLIVPGGGVRVKADEAAIPATYTLVGDDALAVWWWARDLPPLGVPAEAREAARRLLPTYQLDERGAPIWPDDDDFLDDEPFRRRE